MAYQSHQSWLGLRSTIGAMDRLPTHDSIVSFSHTPPFQASITADASGPYAKQPAGAKALGRIFGLKPQRSYIWPYVDSGHVAMEQRPLHLNQPVARRKLQLSFLFSPRRLVDKYSVITAIRIRKERYHRILTGTIASA